MIDGLCFVCDHICTEEEIRLCGLGQCPTEDDDKENCE